MAERGWLLRSTALAACALAAACGSDGGTPVQSTPTPVTVTPAPTPTPTPVPAPTPSPTPTSTGYDTAEYRATVGAVSANALAAYNAGATGAGIAVGVVDSGIDLNSPEFGNRISPLSANVAGNGTIQDEAGHGTAVAFTIAGRRNDAGSQGFAFDATLVVARADTVGTCKSTAASGNADNGCSFADDNIAKGIDLARNAGARVVNLSLGGSDSASQALLDAVNRATAAGIVIVVSAGNEGSANPENSAEFANLALSRGQVIVAGSVGANDTHAAGADTISSFSNQAGDTAQHFLTAVGERVRAPDNTNTPYLWSGTSFSAPQISAAVALLAQAFPNLTGAQIVDILYQTARDAGAPGVDPVYGNGVLDLTRAFQPLGTTAVAATKVTVSTTNNGALSAPMGDASGGALGAVILDGYGRAFAIDLARTFSRASPQPVLIAALGNRSRNVAISTGTMTASLTMTRTGFVGVGSDRFGFVEREAPERAASGTITQRFGATSIGMGFAQGGATLAAQLTGMTAPGFLVADADGMGFESLARGAGAMRQQLGGWGLTATAESGDVLAQRDAYLPGRSDWRHSDYTRGSVGVDRRFGGLWTSLAATYLGERDTVLGARFDPSVGDIRADSWLVDTAIRFEAGRGWSLGGSLRRGWTLTGVRYGLAGGGTLATEAFATDIGKDGVFGHDSAGLRIAQPLRVERGGLDLTLPTHWDYASGSVDQWTTQRMNLAPTGREIDVEARYARPWLGGLVQTNLFWRRDPGNYASLPGDYGLALRWGTGF